VCLLRTSGPIGTAAFPCTALYEVKSSHFAHLGKGNPSPVVASVKAVENARVIDHASRCHPPAPNMAVDSGMVRQGRRHGCGGRLDGLEDHTGPRLHRISLCRQTCTTAVTWIARIRDG
jgi:hypothetical protein